MMAAGDLRDIAEFAGPGNLLQKTDGVDHVRLNLKALFLVERALANGKHLDFVHGQNGPLFPIHVFIMKVGDVQQPFKIAFGKDSRLIGPDDCFLVLVQFAQPLGQTGVKIFLRRLEFFASLLQEKIHARFKALIFQSAPDEPKALLDDFKLGGIKFFGFYQNFFPNADLAEIVQQAGIAQFTHLIAREPDTGVGAVIRAIYRFGQSDGKIRYAERVAGGSGVARFNGGDGSTHKAFKQTLDRIIKLAIFQRDWGLSGQRLHNFLLVRRVRKYMALNGLMRIKPRGKVTLWIDQLQHRNNFFLLVADGHGQNRLGAIARIFVELAVDGIGNVRREMISVLNVDDLAGQRDISRNRLFVYAHGRFAERHHDGIILRQLKAQLLLRCLRWHERS